MSSSVGSLPRTPLCTPMASEGGAPTVEVDRRCFGGRGMVPLSSACARGVLRLAMTSVSPKFVTSVQMVRQPRLDELPDADQWNPDPVGPIVQFVGELVERLVENEGVEEHPPGGTARRKLSVGEGRVV